MERCGGCRRRSLRRVARGHACLFETGGIPEMEVQVRFVGTEFNFLPERV